MKTHHSNFWKISTFVLLFIVLFLLQCERETETKIVKITIPEKSGNFDFRKESELKPITKEEPKEFPDPEIIVEQVIDSTYYWAYMELLTEKEKEEAYKDAITIKQYYETYKDDNQKINVFSEVRGTMIGQSVDYTIFETEQSVEIEIPRSNALFLYTGTRTSFPVESPAFEARLMFLNKKQHIFSLGIDTKGEFSFGGAFKLF